MSTTLRHPPAPVSPSAGAVLPLGVSDVAITGGFWQRRQQVNAEATIPHCQHWQHELGWVGNFALVRDGGIAGHRHGREFSDSEIYKLLEAMAWETGRVGGTDLSDRIDEIAALVAAAQRPDGYLNTAFGNPGQPDRYSNLTWGHELYCYGHLIQAGVARMRTGHEDGLARVAIRAADHVCDAFGPEGRQGVCGHPEIETALVELYRVTGKERYLDQARLFVERRGHGLLGEGEFGAEYWQDDVPVRQAQVLRGHAVRALYLTAGVVDLAVETGDSELLATARRQYDQTLARRTYITGGMGAHHQDEAFGADFELPPDRSYCETCAGVASIMVAWRLLLATGDLAYGDVIERTLYNVIAAAVAEDGRSFFYANPLQVRTPGAPADPNRVSTRASSSLRAPWFEVSCCPPNVARLLASLGSYVTTTGDGGLQLLQFLPTRIDAALGDGRRIGLSVATDYPRDGRVTIRVDHAPAGPVRLDVRIPGWAHGATLDGVPVAGPVGSVARELHDGDEIVLDLPIAARITVPDDRIDAVRGCVAVERGPVVMCLESTDLPGDLAVDGVTIDTLEADGAAGPGERVVAHGRLVDRTSAGWPYGPGPRARAGEAIELPLIPYHSWGNRGPATMRVWLPTSRSLAG